MSVPLSILIPTRNEGENLKRCLRPLVGWADEIVLVDSQSTDNTIEVASAAGAELIQFHYSGGWPKKRQWALDNFPWRNEWILLLDADEILSDDAQREIEQCIKSDAHDGYLLGFRIVFLGKMLRFGDTTLWKLSLFRRGKGRFERRLAKQDMSMSDVEVHEHVVVDTRTGRIASPIRHENVNSLHRYIEKHNEYSTWEAAVFVSGEETAIQPRLFGTQAQRRRWLKRKLLFIPGSPLLRFLYVYFARLGFLDGRAGLAYATFKFIQTCHAKMKIYEQQIAGEKLKQ